MAILNIDQWLDGSKVFKNRIGAVGIELEGGWLKAPKTGHIVRDGSVTGMDNYGLYGVGEVALGPMEVCEIDSSVRSAMPSHVNETCGLHIHMSFRLLQHYINLMHVDFQDTMIEYLKRWGETNKIPKSHTFWSRLRGESDYCQLKFWPDAQVSQTKKNYHRDYEGHRYTAINFCYGQHGTLEVRVLPMFNTPELCVSALNMVCDITNGCLAKLSKHRPRTVDGVIEFGDNGVIRDEVVSLL